MSNYCCETFTNIMEHPDSAYDRKTTFEIIGGKWYTNFSDNEYGDIELIYCPFCGVKL